MCLMLNHFFSHRPSVTESTVSVVKTVSSASANNSQRPKLGNNRRHGNQSVAVTHKHYMSGFEFEITQCALSRYVFQAVLNNM
jgi:hypothetical protein